MDGDKDPQTIVEEKGLKQESDPKALEAVIEKIIIDNPPKKLKNISLEKKSFLVFLLVKQ